MVLVLDIGNSGVNVGLFDGDQMVRSGELDMDRSKGAEDYAADLSAFLSPHGIAPRSIEHIALGSVVRAWGRQLSEVCAQVFGRRPVTIHGRMDLGLRVCYDDPDHVGIDRLAAASAAYAMVGGPVIVVDVGTAITVDAVSSDGVFLGGVIAPGIWMSAQALHEKTDLLPLVRPGVPSSVLGRTTVECIQSGLIYGAAAMIGGLVRRVQNTLGEGAPVVGTGGGLGLILSVTGEIHRVEPYLVLRGLRLIYEREKTKKKVNGRL